MMKAIELLEEEHRLIEHVLDSLEIYAQALGRGEDRDRGLLKDYVAFIRGYADKIHHGKEEHILFAQVSQQGAPEKFAAELTAVHREHELARLLTDDLAALANRSELWSESDRDMVEEKAIEYITLLRKHILDEDDYVFPKSKECLPSDVMHLVGEAFQRFEDEHELERRELRRLAASLIDRSQITNC
ncbi:MAG: hemerythrin domain-containing protein [Planctomycetota bacterium]|jgi:hemerythrin-like domain-containing protein